MKKINNNERASVKENSLNVINSTVKYITEFFGSYLGKAKFIFKMRNEAKAEINKRKAVKRGLTEEQYLDEKYKSDTTTQFVISLLKANYRWIFIAWLILAPFLIDFKWMWFDLIFLALYIPVKYLRISTLLDTRWILKYFKKYESENNVSISKIQKYADFPLNSWLLDNDFEDFLNAKYSGDGYANIIDSELIFSEHYGWIRRFKLNTQYFRHEVKSLEEFNVLNHFIIPQKSYSMGKVYYQVDGYVLQAIDARFNLITKDEFVNLLKTDEDINHAFPEVKEELEKLAEQKAKMKEAEENFKARQEIVDIVKNSDLGEDVQNILYLIRKNKDVWNFNFWNANENLNGNDKYFKVRCKLLNGKSLADVEKLKDKIQAEIRHSIMLKARKDRGAFDLIILLDEELKPFALKNAELEKMYNEKGLIFIGNSLTGALSSAWNFQANHFLVGGMSGSGKSVEIVELLQQLANISKYSEEFDYSTMYLTSSSKIGDFVEFEKAGALVASGIDKQLQVFRYVLKELEEREALFYRSGVQNIEGFNKKNSDKRMKQLILLADEYENTRQDLDKKKANEAEGLINAILNIARSSGAVVIIGAQSILKGSIGVVADKMTVKFSGYNKKNVLNTLDTEIANYYQTLNKKAQGVFFYEALNLKPQGETLNFGDSSFNLVQTPYISDISAKTLGKLNGAELASEIFSANSEHNIVVEEYDEEI